MTYLYESALNVAVRSYVLLELSLRTGSTSSMKKTHGSCSRA